eukprot:CAMPEP_0113312650 /NCGR_PEP_ID=MMETSP0010_2-20120614/9402_1 /TAXON_ID=216773 ORGANISM="Corethron hystrix, Strain 308" /NCGR_SAMPLE_ID=MMETSP0010_2 /ASSEMBLY_ACC=CAM_ASM_000155 /LENGTH=414 /DNA_ID=CAMNT_0000168531 /DNA_START=208 /DNA_END=1452 /DNA_ORIENTATION=+ /assembly_acc=CAM_ASM_000155
MTGRTNSILSALRDKGGPNADTKNSPSFGRLFSLTSAPSPATKAKSSVISDEARVRVERGAFIDAGEKIRTERVSEDAVPYLILAAVQFLPFLSTDKYAGAIYFITMAVMTVYVGGRQYAIDGGERVEKQNALYAPIGASVALFLLYGLLKFGIDPTIVYSSVAALFGALAVGDQFTPLLRAAVPWDDFADKQISVPKPVGKFLSSTSESQETLPLDGVLALGLGIALLAIYWSPAIAITDKFLVSNVMAWSIGMVSLAAVNISSFQTGAILLGGLFFYDIFWVFGTEVMMTVATKIEAPVKFLYYTVPPDGIPREYPFSVLGLGDIVIPGLFVRMLGKMDKELQPLKFSYFNTGVIAYAIGLMACFIVNNITQAGQPALLYLDPLLVGGAALNGMVNGQLSDVWNYELGEDEN